MRNLKKILALALALVMSLSLVTVANATSFSDDENIEHQEAVEVLTALGILEGMGNNTFDPDGYLTRAQIAKLITIITLGDVDVSAFMGVQTDLTDINGHWAEGYIKYCYSQGIISGRGNGRFDPNDNVTAVEAAKTLLTAIGYNSDVQGYEGAQWAINVTRDAQLSRFYEELSVTANEYLTRDDAAQMVYNAIDATMIERTSTVDRTDGTISDHYGPYSDGRDLLSETFGCERDTYTLNGDHYVVSSLLEGQISLIDGPSGSSTATITYTLDNGNEWIGEKVEVLWKDNETRGTRNSLDRYDTVYGVFNNGETEVVNVTVADINDDYGEAGKVEIDDVEYDVTSATSGVLINTNYGASTTPANGTTANVNAIEGLSNETGDTVKFILNDANEIERAYVVTSKIAAVTAVNSERVTMNNGVGSIEIADNDVYEDIARGDVVVVTTLYKDDATDDGAYTIVELAETVSGEVTGFKGTENVSVDGTAYNIYDEMSLLNAIPDETPTTTFTDADIGEDFTLYLVNGYVGAAIQTSESANNYSVVLETNGGTAGSTFNALELEVLGSDGTTKVITVNDDSAVKTSSGYHVGDIITYTGSDSNALVTIEKQYSAHASYSYKDNTKTFNNAVTTADAVLYAEVSGNTIGSGDEDFKAYSIRDLDDFGPYNAIYVTDSNDKVVAVVADLAGRPSGASSNTVYAIVTAESGRVKIGDDYYYSFTAASNEETYTMNVSTDALSKGDLVSFEPTADDTYTAGDVDVVTSGAVYVKEYSEADGTLTYFTAKTGTAGDYTGVASTQTTMALDDDCAIVYVDADGDAAGAEIGVNAFDAVNGYKNAVVVMNDAGDAIVAIFVETSNKCDILDVADILVDLEELEDQIAAGQPVEIIGSVPVGNLTDGTGNVVATLKDATVSGETMVAGVATFEDDVTIEATGEFEALEVTLAADSKLTLVDGSKFTPTILHIEADAVIAFPGDISFTAERAFSIDFSAGTIGDYTFEGSGLAAALTAVQGYAGDPDFGYGSWTF